MKITSFNKILENWLEVTLPETRNLSPRTVKAYKDSFVILFGFFKEKKNKDFYKINFSDFDQKFYDDFVDYLKNERKYSQSSVLHRISILSSFFKYASNRDTAAIKCFNAAKSVKLKKPVKGEFPYFTKEEIKTILSVIKTSGAQGCRDKLMFALLYDTGMRAQEISDLKVKNIIYNDGAKCRILGKGNKIREVPISSQVVSLLSRYLEENGLKGPEAKNKNLFPSQRGDHITPACIRNLTNKYVNIAKKDHSELFPFEKYSPHSFRHSRAMHMLSAGVPLIYIKDFLGHSSVVTTEIYAQVEAGQFVKSIKQDDLLDLKELNAKVVPNIPDYLKESKK